METSKENMFQNGPYLTAAFLCERILEEKDGVKSAIRIHDKVVRTASGPKVPDIMPPLSATPTLFLSLKNGQARGKHVIKVALMKPDSTVASEQTISVNLAGADNNGTELVARLQVMLDQEGVYWFDIYYDDLRVTRVPWEVVYLIQTTGRSDPPSVM